MTILHGDHTVNSRNELQKIIDIASSDGKRIEWFSGNNLSYANLESALGTSDLFGGGQLIVMENLLSGRVTKAKNSAIDLFSKNEPGDLVIWEDKKIGVRQLNKFKNAKKQEFPLAKALFNWLDSIGVKPKDEQIKKLHLSLEQEESYFVFLMLARQIRMLIQMKDSGNLAGSPFVVSKVRKQAEKFNLEKLLSLHNDLLQIDLRQKTSQNRLSLTAELDLLLLNM